MILLKKLEYMLEDMEMLIRFKSATVYDILRTLNAKESFSELAFIKYAAEGDETIPFCRMWEKSVRLYNEPALKAEDQNLILSIGHELGKSDINGQINALQLKKNELKDLISIAETEYRKKGSLYRSVGVLTGAFITILLI